MKNLKFFFAALVCATMTFVACEDPGKDPGKDPGQNDTTVVTPPTSDMPEVAPVEGKIVVVFNAVDQAEVCNGLVFAGDYNGYNTNAADMAAFEPIEGYANWFKVEITPCTEEGKTTFKTSKAGVYKVVYKAFDNQENRMVAIKILKEEFLSNEEFLRRFKNESKAIAMLSHPNIVNVYDVSFGDLIQYIVMEYIDGITLKEYIDKR